MALKVNRKPKPKELIFPGSLFYKEDLKEIYSTLKRKNFDGEVEVKVWINKGDYEIDSIDDFDDPEIDDRKFRDIRYEASHEGSVVIVEVGRESGKVTDLRRESDIVMSGVAEKVLEISRKRENHLKFFGVLILGAISLFPIYFLAVRFLVGPIIWASEFFGFPVSREILVEGEVLGLVLAIFYMPCMVYGMTKMGIKGNTIVNFPRGKSQIFRDKLRDNWQASAFWALVSAVLGFLLGKFI